MVSGLALPATRFVFWSLSGSCIYLSVGLESGGAMQGCTALRKPQLPPPRGKSVGNPISSLKSLQKGSKRSFVSWPCPLWIHSSHESLLHSRPHRTTGTCAHTKRRWLYHAKTLRVYTSTCLPPYRRHLNYYNLPQMVGS